MFFYSTKNKKEKVDFKTALFKGLPDDNGLYMPLRFNKLSPSFIENIQDYSLPEIAYQVSKTILTDSISNTALKNIVNTAINFPAPVIPLNASTYILELFHGPSLAFKDFGARFMAQCMSHFLLKEKKEITILVATSGDTGGAVAAGFYKTPGVKVVILYPKGKVSTIQEKQLTTLGENITALEIDGTFDDCQALVKQAFLDSELRTRINLSSANSINIARLIPQSFYYFEAYKQLKLKGKTDIVFIVPSGNFGNITAGLFAQKLGLPVHKFIAAVNANDVFTTYIYSGKFLPKPSVRTISNAMDVGNPSNFARINFLNDSSWNNVRKNIASYTFTDAETEVAMREVKEKYNYILEPHAAVGYLAWQKYVSETETNAAGVILGTAHAAKFYDDVTRIIKSKINIPESLQNILQKEKIAVALNPDFKIFKSFLLDNFQTKI